MRTLALETAVNIFGAIALLYGLWAFMVPRLIAGKYLLRKKHLVQKKYKWDILYLAIQTKTSVAYIEKCVAEVRAIRKKKPTARNETAPLPGARQN